MDPADFDILAQFQQAIGNPAAWLSALGSLARGLRAEHAHFFGKLDETRNAPLFESAGLDESDAARFQSQRARELWRPLEKIVAPGQPTLQQDVIPDSVFERSDFYNELVRPAGGFHGLSYREPTTVQPLQFVICRAKRQGEFQRRDSERLGRLVPHLTTAHDLHRRLQANEQSDRHKAAALDLLDEGVLLIGDGCRVIFANQAASRLLEQPDAWLARAQIHEGVAPGPVGHLRALVASLLLRPPLHRHRCVAAVKEDGRTRLLVDLVSMPDAGPACLSWGSARICMFIRLMRDRPALDPRAIGAFHGLTERESKIAVGIAEGRSVRDIAKAERLTENTVRFYLKQIFAKVGVDGQLALSARLQPFQRRPD